MNKVFLGLSFLLFFSVKTHSQQSYLDSLQIEIQQSSSKDLLKVVNAIPYGDFVAEVEKSEKLFKSAQDLAIKLQDSLVLGELFFKLGQLKAYQNKPDESLALTLRAITIFEHKKAFTKAGTAYGGLGYNLKRNNIEKSLYYMRKGIKLLEKTNDAFSINPVYDNYGVVLNMVQKNDSALYYQLKSLAIKKQLKDSIGLGYSYGNIANTFAEKKDFNAAKKYVDSSSLVRNRIADKYGITVNYVQKGEILMLEQNYREAINNFTTCAALARKYKYKHLEQYCYEQIAKAYVATADYKNAYAYKEKFQTLKDSSNNLQTNHKIEELQIQFETEKKEKRLAEVHADLLTKEAEIKNRTTLLYSTVAFSLFLGLIGYLVYKQQKTKQKQLVKENELKQALINIENQNNLQQQRLAISKDLHDNIGSQLTFIISSLDNLKFYDFSTQMLYPKFERMAEFTRRTINDLRDTIWAMNKEEITFEDLKTRTINFIESANASLLGIQFEFDYPTQMNGISLNSKQGIEIYRIIQEAINNSIKHAKATKIEVRFKKENQDILVLITDDGKGFVRDQIEEGNGLYNMQNRASKIPGTVNFLSSVKGTTIQLKFAG